MPPRTLVFGPAYLDRVLRVDRPLLDPAVSDRLDRSVEGRVVASPERILVLSDDSGSRLAIAPPPGWPGPWGEIRLSGRLAADAGRWERRVEGVAWHDDLGGMGAGYAKAFGGTLVSALGDESDPTSLAIAALVGHAGIRHRPILVPGRPADWTLLVTSGPHGDKLPIGLRGCHAALTTLGLSEWAGPEPEPELVVVASFPNRLALEALQAFPGSVRLFAPAMRNAADREPVVGELAGSVDVLCCNREEWGSIPPADRERFEASLGLLSVTDGPRGAAIRFRSSSGSWDEVAVEPFTRTAPPRDTNRAGEAFASTLVATLLDEGWWPGRVPAAADQVARAARRASAASALELDMERFGFPDDAAIDAALGRGVV